jgi:hypothetical protein
MGIGQNGERYKEFIIVQPCMLNISLLIALVEFTAGRQTAKSGGRFAMLSIIRTFFWIRLASWLQTL